MEKDKIREKYRERFDSVLESLSQSIEDDLREHFAGKPHIDRISARPKSIERFIKKAMKQENGRLKYNDPLNQIQDQIGARIICYYLSDVDAISAEVLRYFSRIEEKYLVPDSESEFGYFGKHFILHIPTDCSQPFLNKFEDSVVPKFFELQIKTLYQHAWSEASHDLGYKPPGELTGDEKRKIAFTAAQSWGADMIFNNLINQTGSLK
jgi:putative GTP pyrophosphokinase